MPWCPECKNEYVDGVEFCSDCQCELVDQLDISDEVSVIFGEEDFISEVNSFLEYNGLSGGKIKQKENSDTTFELYVKTEDVINTKKIIRIFLQEKSLTELKEQDDSEEDNAFGGKVIKPYQNKVERAEEVKASAYTLTVVGVIGLVLVILLELDLLPISLSVFSKHMMAVVMGALFVLFTYMGVQAFLSLNKIKNEGNKESNLTKEMKKWCAEYLLTEKIDSEIFNSQEEYQNEIKYFMRTEEMKKLICNQFLNLEEGFLDKFIEEEYTELYKDED